MRTSSDWPGFVTTRREPFEPEYLTDRLHVCDVTHSGSVVLLDHLVQHGPDAVSTHAYGHDLWVVVEYERDRR